MRLRRLKINAPDLIALLAQAVFVCAAYFMFNHLWGTRKAFYEENKTMLNAIAQRSYLIQKDMPENAWDNWKNDSSYSFSSPRTDRYFENMFTNEEIYFIEKFDLSFTVYRDRCVKIDFDSRYTHASARHFALIRVFPNGSKECGNSFFELAHCEALESGWYYEEY